MVKQLIIGLVCEGPTDTRFLSPIIKRTFENILLEYTTNIEILDIQNIKVNQKEFVEYSYDATKTGTDNFGILILCIHSDADSNTDENTFNNKINPAIKNISTKEEDICKVIVPVVPIRMIEAWMLADKECFKEEIGTTKTFSQLGITQSPEKITNPKNAINTAIQIAYANKSSRRTKPAISELYLPIGQKCNLALLERLSSFVKFKSHVKAGLEEIKYIQTKN